MNLFNLDYFVITDIITVNNYSVLIYIGSNRIVGLITDLRIIPEVYGEIFIDNNSGLPYKFVIFKPFKLKVGFKLLISITDYLNNREALGIEKWIIETTNRDLEFRNYFLESVFNFMPTSINLDNKGFLENGVLILNIEGYLYV